MKSYVRLTSTFFKCLSKNNVALGMPYRAYLNMPAACRSGEDLVRSSPLGQSIGFTSPLLSEDHFRGQGIERNVVLSMFSRNHTYVPRTRGHLTPSGTGPSNLTLDIGCTRSGESGLTGRPITFFAVWYELECGYCCYICCVCSVDVSLG